MKASTLLKLSLSMGLSCCLYLAQAQSIIRLQESQGLPLRSRTYSELKGNPYFTEGWSKGIVKLANGQTYKEVDLKYDQLEDQLVFKAENGTELAFAIPVVEFKIADKLFRNGFEPLKGTTEKSYFEILYDGAVKLVKKNAKDIKSYRAYNASSETKTVTDHIKYYYAIDNKLIEFKRDIKSLSMPFGTKAAAVEKYIKDNKLGVKEEEDLIKIFHYYSTL